MLLQRRLSFLPDSLRRDPSFGVAGNSMRRMPVNAEKQSDLPAAKGWQVALQQPADYLMNSIS
jgi:hypothetical protein